MKTYIFKYIEKFHQKYPNIIIDIYTDPTKTLIQKLKTGEIDIIINKFPFNIDKDLAYISLGQSNYIFVANKNYYKINKTISLKELTDYPILLQKEPSNSRASALNYFNQNNIQIKPKMNIASSNLLIDFVKMGFGIGYVTKLFANEELKNDELVEIKVNPAPPICEFGIIKLQNNVLNTACNKFIDTLLNKLD